MISGHIMRDRGDLLRVRLELLLDKDELATLLDCLEDLGLSGIAYDLSDQLKKLMSPRAPFTTVVPTKGAVAVPSFIFPQPAPGEQ